jgi:hypothetical protein
VTIISLGLATGHRWLRRLLSTFGLGEQPACGRIGDCCGEDCPFQPRQPKPARNGFCCSRVCGTRRYGLSAPESASLAFTRHPRSMQLGLSSRPGVGPATVLPCHFDQLLMYSDETLVPKGRLELPWVAPLRPERSASAISPLRREKGLIQLARSRPGDSNPGPAVYETAALPTELGRQARCRLSQPNLPCVHLRIKPDSIEPGPRLARQTHDGSAVSMAAIACGSLRVEGVPELIWMTCRS